LERAGKRRRGGGGGGGEKKTRDRWQKRERKKEKQNESSAMNVISFHIGLCPETKHSRRLYFFTLLLSFFLISFLIIY
jgi:hypothetical protein